jgi:hypothetical protein
MMLQLTLEMLPFAVFVIIGIFAFAEPASRRKAPLEEKHPRMRTFCGIGDEGTLILADPDGKPVPRNR